MLQVVKYLKTKQVVALFKFYGIIKTNIHNCSYQFYIYLTGNIYHYICVKSLLHQATKFYNILTCTQNPLKLLYYCSLETCSSHLQYPTSITAFFLNETYSSYIGVGGIKIRHFKTANGSCQPFTCFYIFKHS
jgi:hypothetical protein